MEMATFGEMAVALHVSRHRLEDDAIKLRRLCEQVGLSEMGTEIACEGFRKVISMVDEAAVVLQEMSRHEQEILELLRRKAGRDWLGRLMDTVSAAML